MLDSINVGLTGLLGYSKALRVIANNAANLNTPGYKSSSLQFTDLFYANSASSHGRSTQLGYGLDTAGTQLDFRQGDLRQTGNAFDLGLDGEGLFVLRDAQGRTSYTRAGQFEFNADGVFVSRIDGSKVMGVDPTGNMVEITLAGLRSGAGQATVTARFTGNLSSTLTEHTVGSVKVHDALGEEHTLRLKFTSTASTLQGSWAMELLDGTTSVGTAQIVFEDGMPTAATSKPVFTYAPPGRAGRQITLDFSSDVTSFASGNLSTLAMASQDGHPPGALSKATFNEKGVLEVTYTNGQKEQGARLLLARFTSLDAVEDLGANRYAQANGLSWQTGFAGESVFGAVGAGMLEVSNVDLSREFSELVVMQRGYQASSQVISTANEMLQQLFQMKSR